MSHARRRAHAQVRGPVGRRLGRLAVVTASALLWLAFALCPFVSEAQTTSPAPADVAQARDLFRQGVDRLQAADWSSACDLLGRSLALVVTAQTHFHLARCSAELGRVLDQAEHLRAFARLAGPDVPPEEVDDARNRAVLLDPRIPRVRLRFARPPTGEIRVRIAGSDVAREGWLEPRPVNPGEIVVAIEGARYEPFSRTLRVAEGQIVDVEVDLVPRPRAAADDATRSDRRRRADRPVTGSTESRPITQRWWFWTSIGAVVIVGTGVAVWAATRDDGSSATPSIDFPAGTYVFYP